MLASSHVERIESDRQISTLGKFSSTTNFKATAVRRSVRVTSARSPKSSAFNAKAEKPSEPMMHMRQMTFVVSGPHVRSGKHQASCEAPPETIQARVLVRVEAEEKTKQIAGGG